MLFIFPGDTVILRFYFRFARRMTLLFCLNLEAATTTTTRKIGHIFYLPFAGAIAHNFIPHPKTWSERPQERCNVCDLQYQHHQEFWTNCGKTQGFLAYIACSLDVNLRKNAETRASNGAFSSNSLLFAVYLHLWSTSALFFFFFSTFLVGSVCITCRGWRRHICIIIDTCQNLYYYKHIPIYTHLYL